MKLKVFLLFASLVLTTFCFVRFAFADASSWSQNDWSGGAGQNSWSDITKYSSASTVVASANAIVLATSTSWYDVSWKYRQNVSITNNSGTTITDYQIPIYLNTSQLISGSKMKSDCNDIRIVDSSGVLLPFWIATSPLADTCNQTATKIWVKLSSLDASGGSLYIYYGNTSAVATSDGSNVFPVFGDFTAGSALPSGWVKTDIGTSGSASVGSGSLTISNTNGVDVWESNYGATHVYNNATVNGSFVAEALINSQTNPDPWAKSGISAQNAMSSGAGNGQSFMIVTPGNGKAFQYQSLTGELCSGGSCPGVIAPNVNINSGSVSFPLFLRLTKNDSNEMSGYFSSNGSSWTQQGTTVAPWGIANNQYLSLFVTPHNGVGTGAATYSFFYVRKYVASEPTVGAPTSEQKPYASSGSLISSIFDTGGVSDFGTISYSTTTPTNTAVIVKVRTSNNSDMAGATDFGVCDAVSSGVDISSSNCVTDRERYLQYQVSLSTSDNLYTPTFQSISLGYAGTASFTLNYSAGAHGSVTGSLTQTVYSGDNGSAITAVPETGYHFVNWSDNSTTNPRTDTSVASNVTVTANFSINTYTLTYTAATGGSITGSTPQTINYGSDGSEVSVVPNLGFTFVDWNDGSTSTNRIDTNIIVNTTFTANFTTTTYTLKYSAGTGGTISGSSPQTVDYGSSGSAVTAVANSGYSFSQWSDGSTSNPRTDTSVTSNSSVSAVFTANSSGGGGGFVAPSIPKVVISPSFLDNSLSHKVGNVYQMAISDNPNFIGSSWEPYSESYKTNQKKIYIKFRSRDGGESSVYTLFPQITQMAVDNSANNLDVKIDTYDEKYKFTSDLKQGMKSADVKQLQKCLNEKGFLVDTAGVGSPGNESTYFGRLTRLALIKFQKENGITPLSGYFGPLTRKMMNSK